VENVAGSGLKTILPEKDFFGGTCLFCGLKEAAKVSVCLKWLIDF